MSKLTRFLCIVALCSLSVPVSSIASSPEPRGYGEARFGMTVEEVKRLYPEMSAPTAPNAESPASAPLPVERYQITDRKVGALNGCGVVFQFYRGTLMLTEFYCPDKKAVGEYVEREHGPPSSKSERVWFWFLGTTVISYNPKSGAFSFADKDANQALQMQMLSRIMMAPQPQDQPVGGNSGASGGNPRP